MALLKAQLTWRMYTLLPEDVASNTWYFSAPNVTGLTVGEVAERIIAMCAGVRTSGATQTATTSPIPVFYFSPAVLKVYDMADPIPRSPIAEFICPFTPNSSATPLATETCLVMSFRAPYISGVPNASRRGRSYLPFTSPACVTNGTISTFPRPSAGAITAAQHCANYLATEVNSETGVRWVVYSEAHSSTYPDGAEIVTGWVNNEWDTQRRRGVVPTQRNEFPINQEPEEEE